MQKGDIVLVNFTGREKDSQKVFDTTFEKTAKENGLSREDHVFKPIPIVIGNNELIKGLEEALLEMKSGEEKHLNISTQKAFGERKKELIRIVPLQQFRKEKINPIPGLVININGNLGKIQTISGGRVRVDFNNELAGKEVEYDLKVEKQVTAPQEQVDVFVEKFFPIKEKMVKAKIKGDEVEVTLAKGFPKGMDVLKDAFTKVVTDSVKSIKKVKFSEEIEKKEKAKIKKTEGKKAIDSSK